MHIPINELILGSENQEKLKLILLKAEEAFSTWEAIWSKFISAPLTEEVLGKIIKLDDIQYFTSGGYPSAERQRICFARNSGKVSLEDINIPIKGIRLEGNFLFERAEKSDFKYSLNKLQIPSDEIGDILLTRDRGAQILCTPETSRKLTGKKIVVRGVEVNCEALEIHQLNLPSSRLAKKIKSVEASTRLDAIASAGFGLSRSKIVKHIKEGRLRVNWKTIKQTSTRLEKGDKIHLENKGSLQVLNIEFTQKERWRVELLRE